MDKTIITSAPFGVTKNGEAVTRWTLKNAAGMQADILDYGCTVQRILVPDSNGMPVDVALGYDDLAGYEQGSCFFGAFIGRYANRIKGAAFELNGRRYTLEKNDGENHLHGVYCTQVFAGEVEGDTLVFRRVSPDGEEGYPGTLTFAVRYRLTADNTLEMDYRAVTDADTVVNFTNHTYFNLNGQKDNTINDISFRICAHCFTPTDNDTIPTGEIKPVDGSDMDLQNFRTFADMIHSQDPQIVDHHGFDHNYAIDGCNFGVRQAASAYSSKTGIEISIYSDLPGLQFYTGQSLHNEFGKGGIEYGPYAGFCMEPQYFPNAINTDSFVKPIFSPSNPYKSTMIYIFNIR